MRIVYGLENLSDRVIRITAYRKKTATIKKIEHAKRNLIAELRLLPVSAQILHEFWFYSKHGTYRFFRINERELDEVDHHGNNFPCREKSQNRQFPKNSS